MAINPYMPPAEDRSEDGGMRTWVRPLAFGGSFMGAAWNPNRFSPTAIANTRLSSVYASERLGERTQGDQGSYAELRSGELLEIYGNTGR